MHRRQPLPRLWLMTDERQGEALWPALERLPFGSGIVFRHYGLPYEARRALFLRVRAIARRRGLIILLGGTEGEALTWGADGSHGRGPRASPGRLRSAPAHDRAEIRAAERAGAKLIFLSPVYATRSHAGAEPLGPRSFSALARATRLPVIALGGMDARSAGKLDVAYGWAGIDAWTADQKRKAVPT